MPAFPPTTRPNVIDDFLINVRTKITTKDPTDITTPAYPLFKKLETKEVKGIIEENPGHGPVRDLYYKTEDRHIELSAGQKIMPRDYRPHENLTRLQYDWIMLISSMTLSKYDWENINTPEELGKFLVRKKKNVDVSHRNKQVDYLWNGVTVGGMKLFGIRDVLRFVPTADPARGAVGGIGVADLSNHTNQAKNFNAAYNTLVGGGQTQTFLDEGTNSLLALYTSCGYNASEGSEAFPDLMPCNEILWRCMHRLAQMKLCFYDDNSMKELGVPGITFQTMTAFYDRNVPNDPNNSAYGVGHLWNSNSFEWAYAKGIRNRWSDNRERDLDTAVAWDKVSQMAALWHGLDRFGVIYGVIPTVAAS